MTILCFKSLFLFIFWLRHYQVLPAFKFIINYILKNILVDRPYYEKKLKLTRGQQFLKKEMSSAVWRGFSNVLLRKLSLNYPVP